MRTISIAMACLAAAVQGFKLPASSQAPEGLAQMQAETSDRIDYINKRLVPDMFDDAFAPKRLEPARLDDVYTPSKVDSVIDDPIRRLRRLRDESMRRDQERFDYLKRVG